MAEILVEVASSSGSDEGENEGFANEEEDAARSIYSWRDEPPFQNLRPTDAGRSAFNGHDHDQRDRGHVATVSCENLGKRAGGRKV